METKYKTFEERAAHFWSLIEIRGSNECWLWTHSTSGGAQHRTKGKQRGYGQFFWPGYDKAKPNQILFNAAKIALELTQGKKLKPGNIPRHTCDNPPCCNPKHLHEGTYKQNTHDIVKKGKHISGFSLKKNGPGDKNSCAKVSNKQVAKLRRMYSTGKYSQRELGLKFGVSQSAVSFIILRKHYK
jgi:hypothetical protein